MFSEQKQALTVVVRVILAALPMPTSSIFFKVVNKGASNNAVAPQRSLPGVKEPRGGYLGHFVQGGKTPLQATPQKGHFLPPA